MTRRRTTLPLSMQQTVDLDNIQSSQDDLVLVTMDLELDEHQTDALATEEFDDEAHEFVDFSDLGIPTPKQHKAFIPRCPSTFDETGLSMTQVEHLILKHLLNNPGGSEAGIARDLALPASPLKDLLRSLKRRMELQHVPGPDSVEFYYDLTSEGRSRAMELREQSSWSGPAPVLLSDYRHALKEQSLAREHMDRLRLQEAFEGLVVGDELLSLLGPAMCSGRGLFLFGNPGNGKTSIALRMVKAYSEGIFIPHALMIDGYVIQVFDPQVHQVMELPEGRHDPRWVYIQRPVVVAGGELKLSSLDLSQTGAGLCEASLQLKANGGILLIDDFGRQRCSVEDLLNRWILPLESRVDYLRLPSGRKFQVPFDPLLVFSTNLEPRDLVDEAFVRRIPYKICFEDPSLDDWIQIFREEAGRMDVDYSIEVVEAFAHEQYVEGKRGIRRCHPRDLLLQILNQSAFTGHHPRASRENLDQAAKSYFTLL